MNPPILVVRHKAQSELGNIGQFFARHNHPLLCQWVRAAQQWPQPNTLGEYAGLIVLDAPLANDSAMLAAASAGLNNCLKREIPVLAVTEASHLLARALGGGSQDQQPARGWFQPAAGQNAHFWPLAHATTRVLLNNHSGVALKQADVQCILNHSGALLGFSRQCHRGYAFALNLTSQIFKLELTRWRKQQVPVHARVQTIDEIEHQARRWLTPTQALADELLTEWRQQLS